LNGLEDRSVSVGESGALLSVRYGQDVGTAAMIGSAGAIGTAIRGDTAAVAAAEVKAEADLIAQQQRLALCQAKPAECK
jgi:hypothetical protein